MSPRTDIPEPWRPAMENAGLYSFRDLSQKTGISTSTVTALVFGDRRSSEATIAAVADALRLKVTTIREWAAAALGELEPFALPSEANRLTRRQRRAVLAVVSAMLEPDADVAGEPEREPVEAASADVIDLAHPPMPDLSHVAARRGDSAGKRAEDRRPDDGPT